MPSGTGTVQISPLTQPWPPRDASHLARYVFAIAVVAIAYFVMAKFGLALASLHPSATPIWPPTGLALAAVLLAGPRIWPAIFLAAFAANATNAGSLSTSVTIAAGNTLEALAGGYLIVWWSGGRETFATPTKSQDLR